MPKSPSDRRRRIKAAASPVREPPSSVPAEPAPAAGPAEPGLGRRIALALRGNVTWALVTGLAVGFAIGREAHRFGLSDTGAADPSEPSAAFIAADTPAVKAYASMAEFPAGWVKDTDLSNRATLLAGLNDAQKTTVMQALNERNCECGCTFGTLANCLHKDPNCPRSPQLAKLVVDLAKQGKDLGAILTAIDDKQQEMSAGKPKAGPEQPSTPRKVELAAWNPRKGPKAAKVTVVEFSDFQ